MASLTVSEKEHWKERIAHRIDKRIERLAAGAPHLLDRIESEARQRALRSLGLAELEAELEGIAAQKQALERRERQAHRAMLATVRRIPIENVADPHYGSHPHHEVTNAVQRRQAVHEEELLAEDPGGRDLLRLRREKDNLLDTVWLATSGHEIRALWQQVGELLGDEPTPLQHQALALGSATGAAAAPAVALPDLAQK
jgi:hypothetical protein